MQMILRAEMWWYVFRTDPAKETQRQIDPTKRLKTGAAHFKIEIDPGRAEFFARAINLAPGSTRELLGLLH